MNRNDRRIALGAVCVGLLALLGLWLGGETAPDMTNAIVPGDSIPTNPTSPTTPTDPTTPTSPTKAPSPYYAVPSQTVERFPFDPNTADSTQLLRLGLQPWQVKNIYRYRAKGGIYRKKEDFAQLYGLTVKQYRELEPYIRISKDYLPASTLVGRANRTKADHGDGSDDPISKENGITQKRPHDLQYPVKIGENEHVVLNTADTTELRRVPGIGPYYAKEIVRRGKWLGGYVSVDQLDEIENFPQEAKKYFVIQGASPKKLNVNKLGLQDLRKHPYINYYMAKTIVDYRRLHGPIKSLEDLRLSKDFPPEVIRRLEPYVEY